MIKNFINLYKDLDSTNSTNEKVDFLVRYFVENSAEDNAWTIYFLSNKKVKRIISSSALKELFLEKTQMEKWLFDECYGKVGSLSETVSLLINNNVKEGFEEISFSQFAKNVIYNMSKLSLQKKKELVSSYWDKLGKLELLIFNKFLSGNFRIGLSERLVIRAISYFSGVEESMIMGRIMGDWEPSKEFFEKIISKDSKKLEGPYPFYLASPLDKEFSELGSSEDWIAEWKWDGIRAQLIKRDRISLWSRNLLAIDYQFPEIVNKVEKIDKSFVIDGELVVFKNGKVTPFSELQLRLGRKNPTKKILEDNPATIICYDLLEYGDEDIRSRPLKERRALLEELVKEIGLEISPIVKFKEWEEIPSFRQAPPEHTEGLVLKNKNSLYLSGRVKGSWWKYKRDPYTIDAVLLYAEQGTGRRGGLFTNYTFGVWRDELLVPFTKAYSGLNEEEIKDLDGWIKSNTIDRFGPIRSVKKEQVFEIAFENIDYSPRHKAGIAVRFPRILRWRKDKTLKEANKLEELIDLLNTK